MAQPISKPLLCAAALLWAAPVLAQAPQPNCQSDPVYSQFDFWVGEWEVATPGGDHAGHNSISKRDGGCLILEEWSSAGGGSGTSVNFYDPVAGLWRQIWISPGEIIDYSGGLNAEGEMVLEGSITPRGGDPAPFRGIWTPLEDGRVRQHFEQYDADEDAWITWFTGVYTPA